MDLAELENIIAKNFSSPKVSVTGDGYHFEAHVVADEFAGLSPLKRQQMVYASVTSLITSGKVHALSIKAQTPEEFSQNTA